METTYISPQIEVIELEVEGVMCGSGIGGVDSTLDAIMSGSLEGLLNNGGFTFF